jgi:hypothetical protein
MKLTDKVMETTDPRLSRLRTRLWSLAGINPLWLTGIFIAIGMIVPLAFIFFPSIGPHIPRVILLLILLTVNAPILITIINIVYSRRGTRSMIHLAFLYAQIVVVFGVAYFYVVAAHRSRQLHSRIDLLDLSATFHPEPAITGISTTWVDFLAESDRHSRGAILMAYLADLHDCLHFSLVTSATVGYGNMVPVSRLARLLVDLQIAMTVFFVAFGIGSSYPR